MLDLHPQFDERSTLHFVSIECCALSYDLNCLKFRVIAEKPRMESIVH